MRRFAAGVAVVTVAVDDDRFAVTVASLVSLSLEPPLVAISIGLQSSIYEPLRRAGRFTVNLLAGDQAAVAQHFARGGMPPLVAWQGIETREGGDEPLLAGALAWLRCGTVAEHRAGDHTIFVGRVLGIELGRDAEALSYVRGEYRSV